MANPRKFSEKIALQRQREADGTAEFERIMKLVHDTKKDESQCLVNNDAGNHAGPVASNIGGVGGGAGNGGAGVSPDGLAVGGSSGSPTAYRESRGRSVGIGPMRRPPSERKQDRSPYGSSNNAAIPGGIGISNNVQNIAYLSPPIDSSWRRSNSDSALHQSLNMAVAAEGGFSSGGVSAVGGMSGDMNSLHANYQHHNQRSHSPNAGRSLSPHAPRKKGIILEQTTHNQHHQQQHMQIQQQHQQHQQQLQQHLQQQQHIQAQQHHQQLHYNAKFLNCNMPVNSLFKSLQDQTMTFANTGSLPDLTSVHYAAPTQQHLIHQQQQQQIMSPILSPHNNGHERDQTSSPFSTAGGGPASPYNQQQQSPTSAATTPTAAQTSPHLSFTNLAVQSPNTQNPQSVSFSNLPTLGAANSTGNLTDYRQPLNPPSPGSSPGLIISVSVNELHTSAPASPMRHSQANLQHNVQGFNEKNIPTYGRYSPVVDSRYNILNTSFHNHFEHISLGDSNSSPEQQQQLQHFQQHQSNNCDSLDFGGFGDNDQQQPFSQNKLLDFNDLTAQTVATATRNVACKVGSSTATTAATTNNNNHQQSGRNLGQQQLLNNNSTNSTNTNGACSANNNVALRQQNDSTGVLRQDILTSPVPSPLGCAPPPSAPLPIPISSQAHHHHNHQLSLSLHSQSAQHSPHHSPVHSPHHVSPLSASSPGITTLGISTSAISVTSTPDASNAPNPPHNQEVQHQLQSHANTPTTANIPSIFLSDYSIFDTLDLDLEQMDVAGLQMLDQNTIMIADPTVEDSFRRDLN